MSASNLTLKQQVMSIWQLGGLRPKDLAKRVWSGIDESNLLGRAAELAYNFLVAIFPMMLFLLALFGLFASENTQLRGNLLYYFSRLLPPSAFDLMSRTISEVTRNSSGGKLTFGILLALLSASGGMSSLISGLNGAYGVRESRSWLKVRAIALGLTVAISTLVVGALALVLVGDKVAEYMGHLLHLGPWAVLIWKILQFPIALIFVVVSFSLIYYFGPDLKEQHWYWVTPGSFFGVLLWLAASLGLRVYLHFFNSYSKTYGSLGTVIILLIWLYVTGLAFLFGGEINAQIEHAAAHAGHPEAKARGDKAA
jgi:membrane protein